jgi:DNA mismatch endonuclease (patch repair protein)
MRAVGSTGTGLERRLWSTLAGMRVRGWRKNVKTVVGKPDVVFEERLVALFVDGCFWHGCPDCRRPLPVTNREYWERKIRRNVERSLENDRLLEEQGWTVVRIWEHEMSEAAIVRSRIRAAIGKREA